MNTYLIHAASAWGRASEQVADHGEANPSTFLGLGLIATAALVIWLARRA